METVFVGPAPRIALSVHGNGPLVLFLHGIGGNRHHWREQLPIFATRYKAAAWDARGYGESDDYAGPLDFGSFTQDLLRVLDFFKAQKAHLVGLSLGGRIARNFALRHPQRVARLVLANTTPGFSAFTPQELKKFVEERRNRTPESIRALISRHARPGAYEELLASFKALRQPSYLKTLEASVAQDRAAPIEKIRVPTLVITSDEDKVYPPSIARAMAKRIPGAQLAVISGAGHLSNLEQPGQFNQVVLRFLSAQEKQPWHKKESRSSRALAAGSASPRRSR
ncbi:MAG TPA: alpha/beta fold hydrolase [Burkholderiales bacterium]|nr:alpha/beta fold hydrolase [Burkholderiales bacterium]